LPDSRSNLPAALIAFVRSERTDGVEIAHAAQILSAEVTVDSGLRQLFLLGRVLTREVPDLETDRLLLGLGEAAEAIALQHVNTAQGQALTDDLTGTANRRGFNHDLSGALDRIKGGQGSFALAFLDLDGLKVVNDESGFGHPAGDEYIKIFSRKTQDFVRPERGRIFRYGGDEFCVIFRDVGRVKAEQVLAALQQEPDVPPFCFGVSACPEEASDRDGLLAIADEERLYAMKEALGKDARADNARAWLASPHWSFTPP
jgi:diguanylate cyclase (GGDEF)-like protein